MSLEICSPVWHSHISHLALELSLWSQVSLCWKILHEYLLSGSTLVADDIHHHCYFKFYSKASIHQRHKISTPTRVSVMYCACLLKSQHGRVGENANIGIYNVFLPGLKPNSVVFLSFKWLSKQQDIKWRLVDQKPLLILVINLRSGNGLDIC